jgi:PRTRC genetic system ThiF family protein
MKKVHFTEKYLLDPQHPVTIHLTGCGGTGSQVLSCLGRMDATLKALGHPGFQITVFDPDVVTPANCGRQLFSQADMGLNKAVCLVTRMNRFFGNAWDAVAAAYDGSPANIVITCTDNIASRLLVEKTMITPVNSHIQPYEKMLYWLDFGNTQTSGQAILGSVNIPQPDSEKYETISKLKFVTELFDYSTIQEKDSGPSCSLAESLSKQDLFINSTLAQMGCNLLWKLFHEGMMDCQGVFLNVATMKTNPVMLTTGKTIQKEETVSFNGKLTSGSFKNQGQDTSDAATASEP